MGYMVSSEEKKINSARFRKGDKTWKDELKKMEHRLEVTATAYYVASEYYRNLDVKLP